AGKAVDIEIEAREIQRTKKEIYEIISNQSGQAYEKQWADSDRGHWMTSGEARAYGMIDEILQRT
ncbi:MAG: ATP-dependent Clp protease proteolytic subunit, partial [Bacteroidales bacterium]|nr:ATP-dependent Clp protease proteolytic subunit [Bacteroidales bacterium]